MAERTITYKEKGALALLSIAPGTPGVVRVRASARLLVPERLSAFALQCFAEMLERGSKKYSKEAYEEALEGMGASLDFSADGEYLHILLSVREAFLGDALSLLKETLRHPRFSAEELKKAKKEFTQAFHEEKNDTRALSYALFSRHVYGKDEAAFIPESAVREKELSRIDSASLRKAHALLFGASWIISVAGSRSAHAAVFEVFERLSRSTGKQKPPSFKRGPLPLERLLLEVPGKQNIEFFIGNRLPLTLNEEAYLPFSFGLDVLGKRGGFAGRLMRTVREREGLTYSIYAWMRNITVCASGHWNIWTFFTAKDAPKGIASTLKQVAEIAKEGITEEEFARFKVLLVNQFKLAHESTTSTLALYHAMVLRGESVEQIASYPERIQKLRMEDVNRALANYLDPAQVVIAGAGPVKAMEDMAQ